MASLTGNQINNSYQGLLKTEDNGVVGATEKRITDGNGNSLPITAGTSGVSFDGDVDFTGASLIGVAQNEATSPVTIEKIWAGSQAQYDALGTYDANTLYYIS